MCTCTSCKATDALSGWKEVHGRHVPDLKRGGFENWPRGDPAGPRASASAYAAHVAYGKAGLAAGWAFKPGAAPHYPFMGAPRLPYPSKLVVDFIAGGYKKTGQAEAQPVSPAAPCKAPQHFREPDRRPATCKIYAMAKSVVKRGRGRPALDGRRVVVKLEERHIKRARDLGGGGKQAVAAGIRKALSR